MKSVSIKWSLIGFAGYVVLTIAIAVAATILWSSYQGKVSDAEQLAHRAANSQALLAVKIVSGVLVTLMTSYWVSVRAGHHKPNTALLLALCLSLYGAASIAAHPDAPIWHQTFKLILPWPLAWLGAAMARKKHTA